MNSFYLFTGENGYLLRQERHRWIDEFSKKHGIDNCLVVDGPKVTMRELLDDVSVMPFLAERRLIVIDGMPKASKEEVQLLSASIHPQVLVLVCDGKLDKRVSGSKELLATADVKEFSLFKRPQLASWMQSYARERGVRIEPAASERLLEFLGDDMDLLSQEIDKLSLASKDTMITAAMVESQTIPTDEGIVWRMTDVLSEGKKSEALLYAHRMIERGGDAYGLWAILLNLLKNVVLVKAAMDDGIRSPKQIADATGVHPFALRSLQPFASHIPADTLTGFLSWAALTDRDLKTGRLRATDESPEEIRSLIDQFILHCPA